MVFDQTSHVWVIHIGNNDRIAKRAQEEGFVCIGWTRIGDLTPHDTPEKLRAAYEQAFPNKSARSVGASYMQVFRFAHEMEIGEPVVYPIKGSRDILIGKVAGPYQWSSDPDLAENDSNNIRPVEWLMRVPRVRFSQSALHTFGSFSSVSQAETTLDEILEVLKGGAPGEEEPPVIKPKPVDEEIEESEDDAISSAEETVQATKDYLLRRWIRTAQEFEEVAAAVFRAMGYTAVVGQGTHDRGVDVIAHQDPLGATPPILKIQCKSGTSTCGGPAVQQLRGVLNAGEKGILISLGGFSNDARHTEQNDANLILIDAERFIELFLGSYDRLSAEMRHKYPLQQVYVVAG